MTDLCHYKLLSPDSMSGSQDLLEGKNQEDGLRRVQALLADWLRMENAVVLTAAGCSVGAGGRLMAGPVDNNLECLVLDAVEKCQLSDGAKEIIAWKKRKDFGQGHFEEWLNYIFSVSGLINTEASPIDAVTWKRKANTQKTETESLEPLILNEGDQQKLCEYLEKAIYAECALQLDREEISRDLSKDSSGHIPFLAKLMARDTNLGRTHLFTLNYDTLFEQALEELGIQYFDGFSGRTSARFDSSVYGLDIYYPGDVAEGRVRRFDKFLQYYKLHGSLSWYVDESGTYRTQHKDLSFAQKYRAREPSHKAEMLESDDCGHIDSIGILPTSQKFSQTLNMPYAHLFRLFHGRLNQPQTFLLVLGYGFGDDHVNRIIETALMNPSLVMLVVEPNPTSSIVARVGRYQNLGQRAFVLTERLEDGQRCNFQTATFADFAQNVMPDVQWLEDFRQLRRFEEQIRNAGSASPRGPTGGI